MIVVTRLFPHYDVVKVWDYVEKNLTNMKSNGVIPLFMSEQDYQNHVSVICEVRDLDALADFLIKQISPCSDVAFTRTVTLLKPAFHPIPKDAQDSLCRFLIPLKVNPKRFAEIFDKIMTVVPQDGVHIAYTAFSLGEEDMLISVLAENRDAVIGFVSGRIESRGIESIRIGVTHRTKRLVTPEKWIDCQTRYAKARLFGGKGNADEFRFDWTALNRCAVHGPLVEDGKVAEPLVA